MTERHGKGRTCLKEKQPAGQIDFAEGSVRRKTLALAAPMLVAQVLNLLYNIVDRIYIGRIPEIGTAALGAVGLCFPLIMIITACSNLFGSGGAPIFSINRGMGDDNKANTILNTSFTMVCASAIFLMLIGIVFSKPLLVLFGASPNALTYARPYQQQVQAHHLELSPPWYLPA